MNTRYVKMQKKDADSTREKKLQKKEPQQRVCVSRLSTGTDVHKGFDKNAGTVQSYSLKTHIFQSSSFAVQCTCKGGFLLSNVYTVLEVVDEKELISQYLMLWFSRLEFDRFARFKSHGSVRNKTQL